MNWKSIVVLLLSGSWIWIGHYWYCCNVKGACYNCGPSTQSAPAVVAADTVASPILFQWASSELVAMEGLTEEFNAWLQADSGDNILEITGGYYTEEPTPQGYDNLGLARATTLRNLLLQHLPEERIRTRSEIITPVDSTVQTAFQAASVRWTDFDPTGTQIAHLDSKTVIYFPTNSYYRKPGKELNEYLNGIAQRVLTSGELIFLTGHTDNEGSYRFNEKLALKRALRIRRLLRLKGVPREQISAAAKGEQSPAASNETDMGRHQNRRVVLEIKPPGQPYLSGRSGG